MGPGVEPAVAVYQVKRPVVTPEQDVEYLAAGKNASFVKYDNEVARYQVRREAQIHRTVPRVQSSEEYGALLKDIEQHPDAYYEKQNLAGMGTAMAALDDAELNRRIAPARALTNIESSQNDAVVAWAEKLRRLERAGKRDELRAEVLEISRSAGVIGQLLRQMALIPGQTPQGMVEVTRTLVEDAGGTLSEAKEKRLLELTKRDIQERERLGRVERTFLDRPTATAGKALDEQRTRADRANRAMLKKQQEVLPRYWGDMIRLLMQGNVLAPPSLMANMMGNLVNRPLEGVAQTIAATTEGLLHGMRMVKTRTVGQPVFDTWAWAGGVVGTAMRETGSILATGMTPDSLLPGGEVHRGFQPMRALIRMFTEGRSVDQTGLAFINQKAKDLVEATLGVPAEVMFRALSVGDAPFCGGAYHQFLHEIGRLKGLERAQLRTWMKFPDKRADALAKARAREAIYQGESGPVGAAMMNLANAGRNMGPLGNLANALLIRPILLFVKTPNQLAAQAHRFVNPVWSIGEMLVHMERGRAANRKNNSAQAAEHQRAAFMAWGRAGVGMMLWGAVGVLVRAGLLAGAGGAGEKQRELAQLTLKPFHVNISGLARLLRGKDPSWQPGDVQVDYRNMGVIGLAMNIAATGGERLRDEAAAAGERYAPQRTSMQQMILASWPSVGSALLDMGMMKGSYSLLQALKERRWQGWVVQWAETVSSVVFPNTLKAVARMKLDWVPETRTIAREATDEAKWESAGREIVNRIESKTYVLQLLGEKMGGKTAMAMADMPVRTDLFGRPVPQTPVGRNPLVFHGVDVYKASKIPEDVYAGEIRRIWDATNDDDVIPSIPGPVMTDPRTGRQVRLTERQHARLKELVGWYSRQVLANAMSNRGWATADPRVKVALLKGFWSRIPDVARMQLWSEMRRL